MTRLLAILLLLPAIASAAGLGVYNPAQHAVNGFMPTQLPGLLIWLDAGRTGYSNATSVASLLDFSGKGFNATNDTGSKRPTITDNRFNGRLGIQYDGVDDFLICSNVTGLSNKEIMTVFCVISPTTNSAPDANTIRLRWQFGDRNVGGVERHLLIGDSTGVFVGEVFHAQIGRGNQGRLGTTNYAFTKDISIIEQIELTTTGTRAWKDGAEVLLTLTNLITTSGDSSPKATGYAADNHLFLGAGYGGSPTINGFTPARYAEYIVLDAKLTDYQRSQVTRYLGTKYGIVVQ